MPIYFFNVTRAYLIAVVCGPCMMTFSSDSINNVVAVVIYCNYPS